MDEKLPQMPLHQQIGNFGPLYTADQMRSYAADSVKAERKACADLCDSKARKYMKLEKIIGGGRFERMACGAENCADDIRARKEARNG